MIDPMYAQAVITINCAGCSATIEHAIEDFEYPIPTVIQIVMEQEGWSAAPGIDKPPYCPVCIAKNASNALPDLDDTITDEVITDLEPQPSCIVCGSDRTEPGTGKDWVFCANCGFQWRTREPDPFVRPDHPLPIGAIVQQPGGGGGYTGEVLEHHQEHPTAARVRWHKGVDNIFDEWTNWQGELKPLIKRVPREWWPE